MRLFHTRFIMCLSSQCWHGDIEGHGASMDVCSNAVSELCFINNGYECRSQSNQNGVLFLSCFQAMWLMDRLQMDLIFNNWEPPLRGRSMAIGTHSLTSWQGPVLIWGPMIGRISTGRWIWGVPMSSTTSLSMARMGGVLMTVWQWQWQWIYFIAMYT